MSLVAACIISAVNASSPRTLEWDPGALTPPAAADDDDDDFDGLDMPANFDVNACGRGARRG